VSLLDLDWRFLLPAPPDPPYRLLRLLGAREGVAEAALAAGIARDVDTQAGRARPDAVVRLAGADVGVADAVEGLGPGGTAYYEAEGRGPLRPPAPGIARALHRAGLEPAAFYLVHPALEGTRTYLPFGPGHAMAWYARTLATSAGAEPAAAVAATTGPLARAVLSRVAPRIAFVARRSPGEGSVLPLPTESLPEQLRGTEIHPIALVRGDERSRVVLLPFTQTSPEPVAALKLYRAGDQADAREQHLLSEIRRGLSSALESSIPKPLGFARWESTVASIESFVPGQWLYRRWLRAREATRELVDDLEFAVGWLGDFHAETRPELRPWSAADGALWVDRPLSAFEGELTASGEETELLGAVRRRARELIGTPIPFVWQHSDFSSLNVFRNGTRIGVIDWEGATPAPPGDDVFYFVTRWLFQLRGGAEEEEPEGRAAAARAFRELFEAETPDPAVAAARRAIGTYCRRIALDPRFLPVLLVASCARRAAFRGARSATPGWLRRPYVGLDEDANSPRTGNRYAEQVTILAQLRSRLLDPHLLDRW
jgi:hypothetical protein